MIGPLPLDQLRGHVVGRPGAIARPAKIRFVRNRQPEIDDLQYALVGHHHVAGADVPVEISLFVNVFDSVGRLDQEIDFELVGSQFAIFDHVIQTDAVDQLEENKLLALKGEGVLEGLHDVLVLHGGADGALDRSFEADKARLEFRGFAFIEDLEAQHPTHVPRFENLGHAALAGGYELPEAFLDVNAGQVAPFLVRPEQFF